MSVLLLELKKDSLMLEDYPNSFDIEPLFLKRFKPVVLLLTKIPNIFKKDHPYDTPWRSYATWWR